MRQKHNNNNKSGRLHLIECLGLQFRAQLRQVIELTNEMTAASSRIFTSRSSNCSKTSFHSGLPGNATVQ